MLASQSELWQRVNELWALSAQKEGSYRIRRNRCDWDAKKISLSSLYDIDFKRESYEAKMKNAQLNYEVM